jgi:hypothetical protein
LVPLGDSCGQLAAGTADADCASDDFGRHSGGRRCAGANFRGSESTRRLLGRDRFQGWLAGDQHVSKQVGLPNVAKRAAIPADNPQTRDKIELGKKLFFEGTLSADGTVACSTYRNPASAFADDGPVPIGIKGRAGQNETCLPFSTRCATRRSSGMDGRRPSKSKRVADRQSGGNGQVMNESSPA